MLEQLTARCQTCDRELTENCRMLTMTTEAGTRHAYECACGNVIVTVAK